MNCRQLQESLGDHSVGLLDGATLSDFERHVTACAECAKSVRQFRRCMELLDHAAPPNPPADLWLGIRARLELERAVGAHVQQSRRYAARRPWRSGFAATAAGFATAAVVMIGLSAQRPASVDDDFSASNAAIELDWLGGGNAGRASLQPASNYEQAPFRYSRYRDLFLPEHIPAIDGLPRARPVPRALEARPPYPAPFPGRLRRSAVDGPPATGAPPPAPVEDIVSGG